MCPTGTLSTGRFGTWDNALGDKFTRGLVSKLPFVTMRDFEHNISILETLFNHLPESLPLNPPCSDLEFGLDEAFIESEGWGAEFNHQMEIVWRSWAGPVQIPERGRRLETCIQLFREAVSKISNRGERETWVGGWLDKLSQAAWDSGAKLRQGHSQVNLVCMLTYDVTKVILHNRSNIYLFLTPTPKAPQTQNPLPSPTHCPKSHYCSMASSILNESHLRCIGNKPRNKPRLEQLRENRRLQPDRPNKRWR